MDDQKNMIMAAVLSFLVIVLWTFYFAPSPPDPALETAPIETTQGARPVGSGQGGQAAPGGQTGEATFEKEERHQRKEERAQGQDDAEPRSPHPAQDEGQAQQRCQLDRPPHGQRHRRRGTRPFAWNRRYQGRHLRSWQGHPYRRCCPRWR